MNAWIQAITVFLPLAYLTSAVFYGMAFAGDRQPAFAEKYRRLCLASVLGLHLALFLLRGQVAGTFPIDDSWLTVSATVWMVGLSFALVTWRSGVQAVGGIVLAMAALLQLLASAFGPVRAETLEPVDSLTVIHVFTVIFSCASIVLSGLFGWVHLWQLKQMNQKNFGPVYRELPDLEQLARLTRASALLGFITLAAGLNLGIGMAHARGIEGFGYTDPHVLLTVAIWVHFGVIAFSRRLPGINARRASIAALWGLAVLLLALAITLFPQLTFHTFE